jgi:hypothetical protein
MSNWKKEKPYAGKTHLADPISPPIEQIASLNMMIAVGLGVAQVLKDGEVIYDIDARDWEGYPKLRVFEDMALQDPDHDWRCVMWAPLQGQEYQRQDVGKWVLIDRNTGFA